MQVLDAIAPVRSEETRGRERIHLNGTWDRSLGGHLWDTVIVPSSLAPAGTYSLERTVSLGGLALGKRAFLHFEGLTYHGEIAVNGKKVGEVGAYVPADIDVTDALQQGSNRISVLITDLPMPPSVDAYAAVGVNPGWEPYGGIIRDVWLEIRSGSHIENVRLSYQLQDGSKQAECIAQVQLSSRTSRPATIQITAYYGAVEVAQASSALQLSGQAAQTHDVSFTVERPALWSPTEPHLYRVLVRLDVSNERDEFSFRTGFRLFAIKGSEFEWNGKPLVLQGVCRHDMWEGQGFTLTREQMRQDMAAIKQMGANFVRLVHYPHHRYVVDLAEELGLLITEEPGFWQVNFHNLPRPQIEAGLRTLEHTIRRDWNSPAVFGWFLGNESELTVEYLREGKALCNRLDTWQRPVSFANDRSPAKSRPLFEAADLDFFSEHLYDYDALKFDKTAAAYGTGKPLVIDEWGWEDSGHGQIFWERHFDFLLDLVEQGKISGHSFWSWNDMRQYSRLDWATRDGILFSGVVTETRQPRAELYDRLTLLFNRRQEFPEAARLGHSVPANDYPSVTPLRAPVVTRATVKQTVPLQTISESSVARQAWESLSTQMGVYWKSSPMARDQWQRTGQRLLFWKPKTLEVSGVPFDCPVHDGYVRPLVVTSDVAELSIPIERDCQEIYLLGNVTLPNGYPAEGRLGTVGAVLEVRTQGGRSKKIELRNGIEIARSNLIHIATRTEPLAVAAPQALLFTKDSARELYQVLLFVVPVDGRVTDLRLRHVSGPPLALFGVTTGARQQGTIAQ